MKKFLLLTCLLMAFLLFATRADGNHRIMKVWRHDRGLAGKYSFLQDCPGHGFPCPGS